MKCKFCGVELNDNDKVCSACGKQVKKDKFPTWAIVLMVLSGCGCLTLPIVGVVAALTIPTLVANTDVARNNMILRKTYNTFEQAYLMENAITGKYYSDVNDVWEESIKSRVNYSDIDGGIKLADGTELKIEKIRNKCTLAPQDQSKIGEESACAKITIDANGFDKKPNVHLSSESYKKKSFDRFTMWMYSDKIQVSNKSLEYYYMTKKH